MAKYLKLKQFLSKLINTPLIIEENSEDAWTWRKWSDGTVEVWGTVSFTVAGAVWVSPIYYYDLTVNFPSNLFSSAPTYVMATSVESQWWVGSTYSRTTTGCKLRILRINANSTAGIVAFHITGRWAEVDPTTSNWNITNLSQNQMSKAEIRQLIEDSGNEFKEFEASEDVWIPPDLT